MKGKFDRDVWTPPDDVKAKRKQEEEERLATSAFMLHFKNKTVLVGKDGTNAQLINVHALPRSKKQMFNNVNNNISNQSVDSHSTAQNTAFHIGPEITGDNTRNDNTLHSKATSQHTALSKYGIVAPGEQKTRRTMAIRTNTKQTNNDNHVNTSKATAETEFESDHKVGNKEHWCKEQEEKYEQEWNEELLQRENNVHEQSEPMTTPFATAERRKEQQLGLRLPLLPHHLVHNTAKVEVQSLKRMTPSMMEDKYKKSNKNNNKNNLEDVDVHTPCVTSSDLYYLKSTQQQEEQQQEEFETSSMSAKEPFTADENVMCNNNQRHSLSFQPTGLLWQGVFDHIEEDDNKEKESKLEKEHRRVPQKQRSTESAPLRLQTTKCTTNKSSLSKQHKNNSKCDNRKDVQQKREKSRSLSLEKGNNKSAVALKQRQVQQKQIGPERKCSTKSGNSNSKVNNTKESESVLHHTPNNKVIYTPYSLEDYKAMMNKIANTKLGGLGPSDSDEQRRARERKLREREYGMQAEKQAAAALALLLQNKKETGLSKDEHRVELQVEQKQEQHSHSHLSINSNSSNNANTSTSNANENNEINKQDNCIETVNSGASMMEHHTEQLETKEHTEREQMELLHHKAQEQHVNKSHLRQPTPKEVIAARKRRERALRYGLQAASNLQKKQQTDTSTNNNDYSASGEMGEGGVGWNMHHGVMQQADRRVKDADVIAAEKRALLLADLESAHEQKKNAVEMIRRQLRS